MRSGRRGRPLRQGAFCPARGDGIDVTDNGRCAEKGPGVADAVAVAKTIRISSYCTRSVAADGTPGTRTWRKWDGRGSGPYATGDGRAVTFTAATGWRGYKGIF
ncbi:hypothetical protein AB0958_27190 [Streptomyces sp. NPDC006655]|uniref:hypothetical protein n=1 Tax=Streptomyces sp. NPDC006655 TaxID=3156898 RepID=UPI0034525425